MFIEAAKRDLMDRGVPESDAAVLRLSGVNRVELLRYKGRVIERAGSEIGDVSQVIAAWLALGERELPLRGEGGFEGILSSLGLQNDFQEILDRMCGQGIVVLKDQGTAYLSNIFSEVGCFADAFESVADHLGCVLSNFAAKGQGKVLEQSLLADSLSSVGLSEVGMVAEEGWVHMRRNVLAKMKECDGVGVRGDGCRMRVGIYVYHSSLMESE